MKFRDKIDFSTEDKSYIKEDKLLLKLVKAVE